MCRPGRKFLSRKGKEIEKSMKKRLASDTVQINARTVCWATPKTPNTWNHSVFHVTVNYKHSLCGRAIPKHKAFVGKTREVATDQKNYCKICIKRLNY